MILAIGCTPAVVGYSVTAIAAGDVGGAIQRRCVEAVFVGSAVLDDPMWDARRTALDPRTPILLVLDAEGPPPALPSYIHDFVSARADPWTTSARLELVLRRSRAHQDVLHRSEAMSAMGALVAGVAHDVRNRLFGISATVDAFQAHTRGDPNLAAFFDVLHDEVSRLGRQLAELLDYGKATTLQRAPTLLLDVLADAVILSHDLATRSRTQVDVRCGANVPKLQLDQRRITQLFHNLLDNAIQHVAGGRVVLDVEYDDQGVTCRVRDTGPGFAPKDLPRVFEPFFTRRPNGVGLGLAIVQRIAEAHGGRVHARNVPEGGAEIVVRLPRD
jgi:signal transduction histidine kinase